MAYEKLLNEIYAAISLEYLWPGCQPGFVKSESPDWINEAMGLGLEVSQALLPDDGQEGSFIERYLGCRKEELPDSAFERYGERLHFYNGRFWAILPENEKKQDYLAKAEYRFERKLEKLNRNYQRLPYNGLYLFVHPAEGAEIDVTQLFAFMRRRQAQEQIKFDWVFLNCGSVIFVCDFGKNTVEPISLPENADLFLNQEAERLRHLKKWETGEALTLR